MDSLYAKDNKYGFRLNINHPYINRLYLRFKASKGVSAGFPLNDIERREFEAIIIERGILPTKCDGGATNVKVNWNKGEMPFLVMRGL